MVRFKSQLIQQRSKDKVPQYMRGFVEYFIRYYGDTMLKDSSRVTECEKRGLKCIFVPKQGCNASVIMQICQRCGIRDSTTRYLVSPEQCKHDGGTHHHGSTKEWFLTKCSLCGTVLESEPRSEWNEKVIMAKELKNSHNKFLISFCS